MVVVEDLLEEVFLILASLLGSCSCEYLVSIISTEPGNGCGNILEEDGMYKVFGFEG